MKPPEITTKPGTARLTRGMARLVEAWESKDWERLETDGWLTAEGTHLTSEATRLLLGAWDIEDVASL